MSKPRQGSPSDIFHVVNNSSGVTYTLTRAKVEIAVARGDLRLAADGTRTAYVTRNGRGPGLRREWRKVPSFDPELRFAVPVMQLVTPHSSRNWRKLAQRSQQTQAPAEV